MVEWALMISIDDIEDAVESGVSCGDVGYRHRWRRGLEPLPLDELVEVREVDTEAHLV